MEGSDFQPACSVLSVLLLLYAGHTCLLQELSAIAARNAKTTIRPIFFMVSAFKSDTKITLFLKQYLCHNIILIMSFF